MLARRQYTLLFVAVVATIVAGAALSIHSIRGWRTWIPLAHRAPKRPESAVKKVAHVPPAAHPAAIAPVPAPAATTATSAGPSVTRVRRQTWKPSERQELREK